jgi:uncharacterized protein with HEPN domain
MRRDRQRLHDIIEALAWVTAAARGRTEDQFSGDETLRYAIARQLAVVGEAAARLNSELTRKYPLVPWADIVGLRNILVHEYFGVHWPLVWQTVTDDVPLLLEGVTEILRLEFPEQ